MWEVFANEGCTHVVPQDDRRSHKLSRDCWCEPKEDGVVIVHNSQDRREFDEPR